MSAELATRLFQSLVGCIPVNSGGNSQHHGCRQVILMAWNGIRVDEAIAADACITTAREGKVYQMPF